MGPHRAARLSLCCTLATVGLFATSRSASAAEPVVVAPIVVGEGALNEAELAIANQVLQSALARYRLTPLAEDPAGYRLQLTVLVKAPGLLDATLLITTRGRGTLLGGFTVRASGMSGSNPVLLRSSIRRIIEDAAAAMAWKKQSPGPELE